MKHHQFTEEELDLSIPLEEPCLSEPDTLNSTSTLVSFLPSRLRRTATRCQLVSPTLRVIEENSAIEV